MSTVSANKLPLISGVGSYPGVDGIRLGLKSLQQPNLYPVRPIRFSAGLFGVLGTSPNLSVLVQLADASWVPTRYSLTTEGVICGTVFGCAIRLDIDPGTTPGTGASQPRYFLQPEEIYLQAGGEYTGTHINS